MTAPVLDDDTRHHLGRVRRLHDGDDLTVTDGRGAWRPCSYRVSAQPEPLDRIVQVAAPSPPVTIAFALTKSAKPDWTVQKLVEVGVDVIVPFRADRSVVRWDDRKAVAQVERLRAIARGALAQSHRCWLPEVADVEDVDAVVARGAVALDRGGPPLGLAHNVVAVGPEGGWSDAEREKFTQRVGCGDHVLRAETAALTAGALLCAFRSGFGVG